MKEIKSITGRWKQHAAVSGIDKWPAKEKSLAMMMFFAGFSAAFEAFTGEVADLPEAQAMHVMSAMQQEIAQIESLASQILGEMKPS